MADEIIYWNAKCEKCGWVGSSKHLLGGYAIADTGDFGDLYCPKCGSCKIDEEKQQNEKHILQ